MSNIKWIKLNTNMFEDEKIRLIEQMPDADTILVIWIKLLNQAGKTNASGYIYLSENIPYTDEMLATIFNRPVSTVRFALRTFQEFGMITIDNEHFIEISNWEKHQNIEGMERVKKLNAERNKRYRERKKQERLALENNSDDVSVTSRDGTDIDIELDIDKDIKKDRQKNLQPKKKTKTESAPKDFTAKIKDLLPVFSSINNFTKLSKEYWDTIRDTRKTGKVSESIIYRHIKRWTDFDPIVVEYALKEHIDNHAGKREDYTIGILRNTTVEEVKEFNKPKPKRTSWQQPQKPEVVPDWFKKRNDPVEQEPMSEEEKREMQKNEEEMRKLIEGYKN